MMLGLALKVFGVGKLIPASWRLWIAAGAAFLALVLWFGAHERAIGRRGEQAIEAKRVAQAEAQAAAIKARADAITARSEAGSQKTQAQIRIVTQTLVKEVPIHVPPKTSSDYPWPVGAVRLHDAAALGLDLSAVPDPSGKPDDARSAFGAADALSVIVQNYGTCRAEIARLTALQDWIREQEANR